MKAKKFMCILLAFCLVASLCGCSDTLPSTPKEEKTGKQNSGEFSFIDVMLGDMFTEEWLEEDTTCNVSWDKLKLSEESTTKFPKLKETFDEINAKTDTEVKALMYELSSAAKQLRTETADSVNCEGSSHIFIQRADSTMVSWLEEEYVFSGGVHPDYFYKTTNLDSASGESIALSEVISDINLLPALLEEKITTKYNYVTFGDLQEIFNSYSDKDYCWTLDYQGITFWFSPYEIAPYSVGLLSTKILFDENDELFAEKFKSALPDTYAVALPIGNALGQEIEFDLEDDGKSDVIYVGQTPDHTGSYYMFKAVINGAEYLDEINYAYGFDAYLVHKDSKNYIYTVSYSDGAYNMFHALEINGDGIRQIAEMSGTQFNSDLVEDTPDTYVNYKPFFNNPKNFSLSTAIELLGNRDAIASYKTGDDGIPVMTDDFFDIGTDYSQTTRIPLDALILPDKKQEELPAGTELWGLRTDGKSYIDMKDANGREVRFTINLSEYPKKINGLPEEECFDNIMYAG